MNSHQINLFVYECFEASRSRGWWDDQNSPFAIATKLCLIHSEISEAMEGYRTNSMDPHLVHRPSIEVELADAMIRIADLAGFLELDLGGAIEQKMAYNATRVDHSAAARSQKNGKKF